MSEPEAFRVIFVCTGNICRSPMAEIVFRDRVKKAGLEKQIITASAGTGDWHVGEKADHRTIAALAAEGYNGDRHRAKQFSVEDFDRYDLVIALDRSHARVLNSWARDENDANKVSLLRSYSGPQNAESLDVPDPYYADQQMFAEVLRMVEDASDHLFQQLEPAIRH